MGPSPCSRNSGDVARFADMRLFLVLATLAACGQGDPPILTALLTPDPAIVAVNELTQLRVLVGVTDEDRNLRELRVALDGPSGQHADRIIDVAASAGDARNSTITMALEVKPLEVGRYQIQVIAADADGNASEPRITTFDAE